ncbi:hypothetical protein HPB49_004207 [Dermacentor silvarum]|uniref:Uncharacterized protein n=1 Tax=Dermacentor silvarum TaxID=543639 RepID=A0ACB8CV14_DERSI|nr:hypothetical protein HPB49_004207 [Dermacentor silvarum]
MPSKPDSESSTLVNRRKNAPFNKPTATTSFTSYLHGRKVFLRPQGGFVLTTLRPAQLMSALSRLYKDYATITWTVKGRLLKNLIDRSTLSTVKNDGPVKVSKIAINQLERLRSDNGKFIFECTALSTRRPPRQPSRLVPSSRTPARATPSASLAGPRAARAATSTSYPSP